MPDAQLDHVMQNGVPRFLAALPPREDFGGLMKWSSAMPMVPRTQWMPFDRTNSIVPILDQGQHGSCVGHGGCTTFSYAWVNSGQAFQRFSACYLYGNINGGRDAGAIVSDAMQSLTNRGIALESQVPEGQVYRNSSWAQFDSTAARFKIAAAFHCDDYDSIGSAAQLGWQICHGILVGNNFTQLDSDGVAGVGGRGGHCMSCGMGMKKSSSGEWLIKNQNSWGTSYGMNGYCFLREAHFTHAGQVDAFAVQVVAIDPGSVDLPPSVTA